MKKILIITHKDCADGLCAAHVANEAFKTDEDVSYVDTWFFGHQDKSLDKLKENETFELIKQYDELHITDFSFGLKELEYILSLNPKLKINIVDHHKSAMEDFLELTNIQDEKLKKLIEKQVKFEFNNNYSGAVLAYIKYFLDEDPVKYNIEKDYRIPDFLHFIQDRDIWKWSFEEYSKPFNEAFFHNVKDLNKMKEMFPLTEHSDSFWQSTILENTKYLISQGQPVLNHVARQVEQVSKNKREIIFNGEKGYMVNASTLFSSDLGSKLSRLDDEHKFCLIWEEQPDETIKCSLRSRDDYDCSLIAKKYGGGGHKCASAFRANSVEEFLEIKKELTQPLMALNHSIKTMGEKIDEKSKISNFGLKR